MVTDPSENFIWLSLEIPSLLSSEFTRQNTRCHSPEDHDRCNLTSLTNTTNCESAVPFTWSSRWERRILRMEQQAFSQNHYQRKLLAFHEHSKVQLRMLMNGSAQRSLSQSAVPSARGKLPPTAVWHCCMFSVIRNVRSVR
jgi:hypothetical protein